MNKLRLPGVVARLLLLLSVVFGSSCINEKYDLSGDNWNDEVTIFQEGITLPIGETEQIKLGDLLKDAEIEALKIKDGKYYIGLDDTFDASENIPSFRDIVEVPDIKVSNDFTFHFLSASPLASKAASNLVSGTFETQIYEKIDMKVLSPGDIPEEVLSLGVLELSNAVADIVLDASSLPVSSSASLSVELDVEIPSIFKVPAAEGGVLKLSGVLDSKGMLEFDPVKVEALDLTGVDLRKEFVVTSVVAGTARLEGTALDGSEWLMKDLTVKLNINLHNIEVAKLTGRVDYKFDPITETVDLSDISELMKDMDAKLDFCHAGLRMAVATNLGIPVNVDACIVPYYDGKADNGRSIPVTIALNVSDSAQKQAETEYVFEESALLALLEDIPEKLELNLDAYTDTERDCVVEPSADYTLTAEYGFELPLEFGKDFSVSYRDTIPDLPEIAASLLSMQNKVMIAGEIESTFPLGLEVELNLLDSQDKEIPLADGCGIQNILPCNPDGSASVTELKIMLGIREGVVVEGPLSMEVVLKAVSGEAAGVPVSEDDYLQAVLRLVAPEGITVELEEIMDNVENAEYYE